MSCSIIRNENTNKIQKVLAPNGKESILYSQILNTLPESIDLDVYLNELLQKGTIKDNSKEEIALGIWSKVYTPSFKKWFNGSKVVDSNGEPLLVFHGGRPDITSFKNSDHIDNKGIFFTKNKELSTYFASMYENETVGELPTKGQIYPVFLKIESPKNLKNVNAIELSKKIDNNKDGIIGSNISDMGNSTSQLVVFNSNQIKSIFNKGEFNIQSQNIYYDLNNDELSKIDPNLESNINNFLQTIGVSLKQVENIKDAKGNNVNARGKIDLINKVIEVTQGRSVKTLPEEAAHMFTGLLGINHPIVKQMMNDSVNYPEYNQVKEQYKDVLNSENEFRFETVGKIIANRIIGNDSASPELKNWFERLMILFKRLFSKADTTVPKKILDNFDNIAETISKNKSSEYLSQIIHSSEQAKLVKIQEVANKYGMDDSGNINSSVNLENIKKDLSSKGLSDINVNKSTNGNYYFEENDSRINPFITYYDLNEVTQNEITKKLIDSNNDLIGMVGDVENEKYNTSSIGIVKERVSDAQTKIFNKNKSKEKINELNNAPKSVLARTIGTELHDLAENSLNFIISYGVHKNLELGMESKRVKDIPKTPSLLTPIQHEEFNKSIKYLSDVISKQQTAIDPKGKVKVFTENFVLDKEKSRGGSQDVTIVYSDGSVAIYDYKFINFKMSKIDGTYKVPESTEINFLKEKSYDMQLSEYKRILMDEYGVKKIRATRILPFNVQYKTSNGKYTGNLSDLKGFKEDVNYLMPIPVANELSDIPEINNILEDLFRQKRLLQEKVKSSFQSPLFEKSKNELEKLRTSIKNLQVSGNLKPLFESINTTLNNEGSMIKDITIDTIEDLNKMQVEIDLFSQLYQNIVSLVKSDELKSELMKIASRLAKARISIKQKRIDLLLEMNPEINDIQKELGQFSNVMYTDQISQPVFETFSNMITTINGNKNRALKELEANMKPLHENLKKWAKSKGITLIQAFDKIIKDGKLVSPYSVDFYQKRAKAIEESDVTYLKSIYKLNSNFKKDYKNKLKEEEKLLSMTYSKDSNIYKYKLKNWISKNDLINEKSAWLNKFAIFDNTELKNPEKFYSEEYKEMQSNKPLLEYYEFYTKLNKDLNKLVDERIDSNFIPNIRKSSLEMLSMNEGIITSSKQLLEDVKDSFMLHQDDEFISGVDDTNKIPLLHYNEPMVKLDGKWVRDSSKKSKDLTNIMLLFAQSVYKKNELSKIEGIVDALKYHLMEQPVYKTDNLGNVIYENSIAQKNYDSKKNMEMFNKHVLALVYGKKIQSNDTIFANKYSVNKTLSNVMKYFSVNTLALSYISAFGNVASGTGNIYIKAAGGTFFNKKHVNKSMKLMVSKGEDAKYYKMSEYFNIENQNWAYKMATDLSASKLVKNITFEKAYVLWQQGDNMMSNIIMMSMSQNYGINKETGAVERLSTLPEGTNSIFDMFNQDGDKITSGLTPAQFDSFRKKVMYIARGLKGSNTTDQMSALQMTIGGKALMFFKNWLPPMAAERFQGVKYSKTLEEAEYGRYRSLFKDILTNGFTKKLPRFVLSLMTFNAIKYKPGSLDKHYNEFLKKNPDLKNKISKTMYVEMRERTIREGMAEMKMIFALSLLLLAAKMDWDGDGEENYKKNVVTKQMFKLMRRTYLEFSFFADPRSITELVRNPVPIITIATDIIKATSNFGDEVYDRITGLEGNEIDNTDFLHYSKRFLPTKHLERFLEDFQD